MRHPNRVEPHKADRTICRRYTYGVGDALSAGLTGGSSCAGI